METVNAQKALEDLALKVRSNYQSMNIGEIINRVHYITGRNMKSSIEGYKILRAKKLIPDNFVKELDREKRYLELVSAPNVLELIERFGCTLGRVIDIEKSQKVKPQEPKQEEIKYPGQSSVRESVYKITSIDQEPTISEAKDERSIVKRLNLDTNF